MKRITLRFGVLASFAAMLTGCSVVPTQFGGSWPMPVERHSSAAVDLARPALWPKQGGHYVVIGYLVKQYGAATTADSHVDVRLLGADGAVLAEHQVEFQPRELKGHVGRRIPRASYELALEKLPLGTSRISVVAHDEPHVAAPTTQ